MKRIKIIFPLIIFTWLYGCSGLVIQPVDYAWPVECVLEAENDGTVSEIRHALEFNIKPLFFEEFQDSSNIKGKSIRIIRDVKGFYFIVGQGFKNIYVFSPEEGAFKLSNKIQINEMGLVSPAFNQRSPAIELLDGENKICDLTNEGKKESKK